MLDKSLQKYLNDKVGRCTAFTFVFWVTSPDDETLLYSFLNSLKVPSCVSPLHDQDVDEVIIETGEIKFKPSHFHVVIDFGSGQNKTIEQCFVLISPIRNKISISPFDKLDQGDIVDFILNDCFEDYDPSLVKSLEKSPIDKCIYIWQTNNVVRNMRTLIRYFKHLDNPEKFQYFEFDYRLFCGFELDDRVLSQSDNLRLLDEIYDYIEEHQIYSYWKFLRFCQYNNRQWYQLINKSNFSSQVMNAIRSFTYEDSGQLQKYIEKRLSDD